jgi:hypothetical protein
MFFQQKSTIVSLITSIVIFTLYSVYVFQKWNLEPENEFKFWSSVILTLIPVLIVAQIITQIIFIIINTIVTGEEDDSPTVDEFDKLVDLKATRNFYHVFLAGFLLSMVSQVMEEPPSTMFIMLFFSFLLSGVSLDISKIYFYRRGF